MTPRPRASLLMTMDSFMPWAEGQHIELIPHTDCKGVHSSVVHLATSAVLFSICYLCGHLKVYHFYYCQSPVNSPQCPHHGFNLQCISCVNDNTTAQCQFIIPWWCPSSPPFIERRILGTQPIKRSQSLACLWQSEKLTENQPWVTVVYINGLNWNEDKAINKEEEG